MGDLVIGLAALLLFSGSGTAVAAWVDRRRRRMRERAVWKVAEASSADGYMEVFVRKVTADGAELDRIVVAAVRDGHPDWDALVAESRAAALSRAALLNAKP